MKKTKRQDEEWQINERQFVSQSELTITATDEIQKRERERSDSTRTDRSGTEQTQIIESTKLIRFKWQTIVIEKARERVAK
jgi:hypothetical protein